MIYTVTLNPAIDKTVYIDDFGVDKVNRIDRSVVHIGGKGINISKMIAKLGGVSTALAIVGKGNIPFFKNELELCSISYELFENDLPTRVNTKVVDEVNNTFTDINEKGNEVGDTVLDSIENYIKVNVKEGDIVAFSGSLPKNAPNNIYRKWINLCTNLGATTFLDAYGDVLEDSIKSSIDFIKPNIDELENYCNKSLNSEIQIVNEVKKLLDGGIKMVLLSLGDKGSMFFTKNITLKASPISVNVKSTVGAGDSMVAGFLYQFEKDNSDLKKAYKLAVASSIATIQIEGTKMASREQVMDMFDDIKLLSGAKMNSKIHSVKQELYNKLCKDMKDYYSNVKQENRKVVIDKKEVFLEWCDFCEEVNLWTYWQGRNKNGSNNLSPKILLVGQDWGSLDKEKFAKEFKNIKAMNNKENVNYMIKHDNINNHSNDTDYNLIELFEHIGYKEIDKNNYSDLFFTNIFPLYRPENCSITSGFKSSWLTGEMKNHFKTLVHILNPEVILCLGKQTYISVCKSILEEQYMDYKSHFTGNYNDSIDNSLNNPIKTKDGIKIFALAHCGFYGVNNRNEKAKKLFKEHSIEQNFLLDNIKNDKLFLLKEDWLKLKEYIDGKHIN